MAFHDLSDSSRGPWQLAGNMLSQAPVRFIPPAPDALPAGCAVVAPADARLASTPGFETIEWRVISLARLESLASLKTQPKKRGWLARMVHAVFGAPRALPLANPRLEALRRLAVELWHYGEITSPASREAFLAVGFDDRQFKLLQASHDFARTQPSLGLAA